MEETTNNTESMSLVNRMINVYTNPSKSFENLGSYKNWLIPLLVIMVVAIGRQFIMQDLEMAAVKERIERNEKIPDQQKAVIIEQMEAGANSPGKMAQTIGGIVFVTFLFALIAAGLYLFTGNVVFGGSATYSSMLSVYALGSLIFIPEYIVKSALALSKGSAQVYTSLAILLDPAESSTFLFTFLNWIDIFSIWKLAVWAIGFGVVYKFNQTKSWINVLAWYLLGLFVFYGINSLTGGMLG
jgi:hypothetical protein